MRRGIKGGKKEREREGGVWKGEGWEEERGERKREERGREKERG